LNRIKKYLKKKMINQKNRAYFDNISEKYKKAQLSWQVIYDQLHKILEPLVKGKLILDIGNGGVFVYDTNLPKEVIAFDISPKMLEKINDPNVKKIVGDAKNLNNISDNSCDYILYILSIHHIHGKSYKESIEILDKVLIAAKNKLKAGGSVIILEPCVNKLIYAVQKALFPVTRKILTILGSPMIFFYNRKILIQHLSSIFKIPTKDIICNTLKPQKMIDPLGGSLPGLIKIPSFISPTNFYFYSVKTK